MRACVMQSRADGDQLTESTTMKTHSTQAFRFAKPGLVAAFLVAMNAMSGVAHAASTPDAGDYTALPAGTDLTLLYLEKLRADNVYANGNKVALPADLNLNVNVGVLRHVHFTKLGGYTIDPQIIVPFATQNTGLTGARSTGMGDITFGGTLWTIADLAGGEHLGYSVFLTAPTGSGKDQGFAISDNRWAADLQVGYIRRLAPNWTIDLIGQTEFYQDRRDTGARKDALLRGFAHLRYHFSDATHVAASLRYAAGAKETLNGTTLSGAKKDTNLALTWASFVTKQVQVQLQYSKDLHVENGPKLDTMILRLLYAY